MSVLDTSHLGVPILVSHVDHGDAMRQQERCCQVAHLPLPQAQHILLGVSRPPRHSSRSDCDSPHPCARPRKTPQAQRPCYTVIARCCGPRDVAMTPEVMVLVVQYVKNCRACDLATSSESCTVPAVPRPRKRWSCSLIIVTHEVVSSNRRGWWYSSSVSGVRTAA